MTSTHGVFPSKKAEGICRIVYKNVNGLQPHLDQNNKLMKLCDVINKLQAGIVRLCEHRNNFAHAQVVSGPWQMFQQEATIQAIAGHNIYENVGPRQEGQTMMLATDEITQFVQTSYNDKDPSGLGRWVSMAFKGKGGYITWVMGDHRL